MRAAERLKRVNLELGGIDPLIVFEDADLDVAVPGAAWARFLNNGQVCTSAKRIYVVEPIAKAFVERFVAHTRTLRVGNGMDPDTDLGPLISERARDACRRAGRSARSPRARGCSRAARRLEVGPGLVLRADRADRRAADARVVCEEVFGPIASIQVVKDADEAIAAAARSEYGLGANIYTQQPDVGAAARCRRSRPARSGSTIR